MYLDTGQLCMPSASPCESRVPYLTRSVPPKAGEVSGETSNIYKKKQITNKYCIILDF